MIVVENLTYHVGQTEILKDVSVTLPKGGITALIGPNGAGKSSLLSHIARLLPVKQGKISVEDLVVGECADDVLARKLAILPQQTHFATRLTVSELIRFGRYPHCKGRLRAEDHAMVQQALTAFGLEDLADRFLDTLSGGQRHKAQVAMTYAQDTDYLLLDEPLNNLDIAAARSLMVLLHRLAREEGKSVVIVLHDINYAAHYADHIIVMKQGRIAAAGDPAELVTENLLFEAFGTTAKVTTFEGKKVVLP